MAAPPLRTEISDTYPLPSDATARAGFGKLWDYVTGLLGATGTAAEARAALGVYTPGFLFGCQLTMPVASATMPVSAGTWADSTGTQLMTIAAMTKTTSAWAAGTGNGGRLGVAAVANNTWYDWILIYNPTTGTTDLGFDLPGVVTYPAGYTKSRRIFSARTNGSAQWTPCIQLNDKFWFLTPPQDVAATNPGVTRVARTISVPPILCEAMIQAVVANVGVASSVFAYFSDLSITDTAPTINFSDTVDVANSPGAAAVHGSRLTIRTTNAQIGSRLSFSDASTTLVINTLGWIDTRGRD